jgi:DNA polymerase IIIc chi subunit
VAPDPLDGVNRLIEVVGPEERDKASARQRWKQYTQLGFQINRFDLAAAAQNQAS